MIQRFTWRDVRINFTGYAISGKHPLSFDFRPLRDYDLWFVWTGRGTMQRERIEYPAEPGTTMCLRRGQPYRAFFNPADPLGMCYVHFDFLDGDFGHGRIALLARKVVFPAPDKIGLDPLFSQAEVRIPRLQNLVVVFDQNGNLQFSLLILASVRPWLRVKRVALCSTYIRDKI